MHLRHNNSKYLKVIIVHAHNIYKILFNPVNPELGTIPSRSNKIFKNRMSNLTNPGQELQVNKIHRANNFFLKKKKKKKKKKEKTIGYIKIINLFPSC